jgi:hypothetical protein
MHPALTSVAADLAAVADKGALSPEKAQSDAELNTAAE